MILGRPDEALEQDRRAVAFDPLDDGPRNFYAWHLALARRYDEALAQANQVLRKKPGDLIALNAVIFSQHGRQQYTDVIAAQAAVYAGVGRADVAEALKKGFAETGYAGAWRRAIDVVLAKRAGEPGMAWDVASSYAMVGDREHALDWLERAYAERDPKMLYTGIVPIFEPLRAEPRFQALLRKMNLPQ